jgi:hypothetical protein
MATETYPEGTRVRIEWPEGKYTMGTIRGVTQTTVIVGHVYIVEMDKCPYPEYKYTCMAIPGSMLVYPADRMS